MSTLNLKRILLFFYFIIIIVKNIRFGYSRDIIQKNKYLKIIFKFIIQDESKKMKKEVYCNNIELTSPLIYFNDEIVINNVKLSDSLIIKYNKINEEEKDDNLLVIKVKKLKRDIEEDAVWTIGNNSFIILIYELMTFSKKSNKYISNQIYNSVNILNNRDTKFDKTFEDLNGETYSLGGEPTCSTGSTGKSENNKQFHSDKNNSNNPKIELNSIIIHDEKMTSINLQKKNLKENDNKRTNTNLINNKQDQNENINDNNYIILEDNYINNQNNIFSKEYISKLNFSEFEYDTFCQCVLITGLKFGKQNLIEKSEQFPATCGHKDCSILQSTNPSILYSYQNPNKKYQIDINELTPYLIFPLGIKICLAYDMSNEYPRQIKPFMNRIENKNGELFYVLSLIYYKKMTIKKYEERYKINPLLSYSNKNKDEKFGKEMEIISKLALNETVFVPECISLISRFPYFHQMSKCLKALISISDNKKVNLLINNLINQIPVPYKNQEILFYIPNNPNPLKIFSPSIFNGSNYEFINIFNYFSNENIIIIFYLILMEQQILFIDNNLTVLSLISFLFINLIYPFSWSNTYIPILSISSVKFLESIIPYIMGIDESLLEYALENQNIGNKVIFVNISKNDIYLNNKKRINLKNLSKLLDLPKFPENFGNMLKKKLDEIKILNNNCLIAENLKYCFCKFMVVILKDYLEHCFIIDEFIIFNNESFLERKKANEKNFYKELIQTQLFSQYLLSRKEQYLKNKEFFSFNDNNEKEIDYESFKKDSKIISNIYGYIYDNLYIDYSLFHDFEKDYLLRIKSFNKDSLIIKKDNKLRKTLELNKSSKINGNYSLRLIKNKKNNNNLEVLNKSKKNERNNFKTNSLSNFSTNNLSSQKYKKIKTFKDSSKDEENNFFEYTLEESNKSKHKINCHQKYGNQSFLLYPYFIEKPKENIGNIDKDLFIKHKIKDIIKMDIEINKIIKTKNVPDYILPSYKRYEFYLINEDFKRYFPNSIIKYVNNSENIKPISTEFSSEDEQNQKTDIINSNINKKRNNNIGFKKIILNTKDINIINEWFNIICSSDKKKLKNNETNNLIKIILNNQKNLVYFCDLIFQDYIPLFKSVNSNFKKILIYECLNELYKVIIKILPLLKSNNNFICKQLTLSLFIYGYFNQKTKKNKFIISKINEFCNSSIVLKDKICPLWGEINFWNFWLKNDLETYKNNKLLIDMESKEIQKDKETNINIENYEYEYFVDVCKIMTLLGKDKTFIQTCVFDYIAPKFLTPFEICELMKENLSY